MWPCLGGGCVLSHPQKVEKRNNDEVGLLKGALTTGRGERLRRWSTLEPPILAVVQGLRPKSFLADRRWGGQDVVGLERLSWGPDVRPEQFFGRCAGELFQLIEPGQLL